MRDHVMSRDLWQPDLLPVGPTVKLAVHCEQKDLSYPVGRSINPMRYIGGPSWCRNGTA